MFLEKLEVQGFKSFANKNHLVFPGMIDKEQRGITAVVGPNGSGKSNIADAIRWVLGEQSMKTLRGKKAEDVIFSGSDKKGKLGMAEVSLFLNNEDGSAPIDYSQVTLTRRLYRDGNSEYLLNNSRVRLTDVQILLAKAKFGQKTYSVIGQGMVEGFLNTSLSERKEFFDEATGVKQFQIKRDDSLNKLRTSYENLAQAQMLVNEIEPRLKSLTRLVNRLQRKGEIEVELRGLQLAYYGQLWHDISRKFNDFNSQFLELEKIRLDKERKLEALNRKLSQMEADNQISREFNEWQIELASLQGQKDVLMKQIAKYEAELEVKLEAKGQFDLSWLNAKQGEISAALERIDTEIGQLRSGIDQDEAMQESLAQEKSSIAQRLRDLNAKIMQAASASNEAPMKKVNAKIVILIRKLDEAESMADIVDVKKLVAEIKIELNDILEQASDLKNQADLEQAKTELNANLEKNDELAARMNKNSLQISTARERIRLLTERKEQLDIDLSNIKEKLAKSENQGSHKDEIRNLESLKMKAAEQDGKIKEIKDKINNYSKIMQEKQSAVFDLQKEIQALQQEINRLVNQLNDLKVNSARYETKLEDLEAEIRQEIGGLREIKGRQSEGRIEEEQVLEKINQLKRQVEAIGSIDPETEKEYVETKARYDFLTGQINDLNSAIQSLEQVIKELDVVIKEKFDKEFKVISEKFEEYFKILFNGGNAKIIKVLAEDMNEDAEDSKAGGSDNGNGGEPESKGIEQTAVLRKIKYLQKYNATGLAGVEIQATPPGKKIRSISMLSGGERALTAIAMICAIISANPSPFVVLDEVDAALDEANSERLAKILDDLSHKTQFIVISHNRASMKRAHILYGVTMQDDGVSKLLSVKLDEVKVGR